MDRGGSATSHLALGSIALGALIIIVRGPLLFAPAATLEIYRRLIQTDARIRVTGALGTLIGLTLIASASGSEGVGAWVIWAFGWIVVAAAGLFAVPFTAAYRRLAERLLDTMEHSDLPRPMGAFAIAIGALLIYLGLTVF